MDRAQRRVNASKIIQPAQSDAEALSRRKFLVLSVAGALAFAIVDAIRISVAYLKPPLEQGFGGVFNAGPVEEFPPGSITHIRQGRFYVVHNADGFLALFQRCTHLGCLVPWRNDLGQFACPCHAGRYNMEGEVIAGPPPRPLDLFQLEIENGELTVDTGRMIQRKRYEPSQAVKG